MNFLRWSWPLTFSILANLVLFYLFAAIIYSNESLERANSVLQISLVTKKTQAIPKVNTKTVTVKQPQVKVEIPKPDNLKKAVPTNVAIKRKIKPTEPEPNIQILSPPKPVVILLEENRQNIDAQLDEDTRVRLDLMSKVLKPVPLFRLTRQPSGISGEPIYPEHAKALGREAYVMTSIIIGIDGKVREVQIVESGGKEFDEAVTVWLLKQQLNPGWVNDSPVVSKINQPFNFVLR